MPTPRRVLITGATSGIGLGLLEHYAARGIPVVAFNRREDPAIEKRIPGARFVHADVRQKDAVESYFADAARKNELPDLLYLNAGINRTDDSERFEADPFAEVMNVNLMGVLHFVEAAMRHLDGREAVFVATGSTASIFPNPANLGYYASKCAVQSVFGLLDRRYHGRGWRFKTLVLGIIDTKMVRSSTLSSRLQTAVRDFLQVGVDEAVPRIVRFAESKRGGRLYYPMRSVAVFTAMAALTKILPGIYQGSRPGK